MTRAHDDANDAATAESPSPSEAPGDRQISLPTKGSALPALTSVRFFAALAVVVFHIVSRFQSEQVASAEMIGSEHNGPLGFIPAIIGAGSLGPNLFFVLSGFVLYWSYEASGNLAARGRGSFYLARAARLLPVYLLALLLGILAMLTGSTCLGHDLACTRGATAGSVAAGAVMQQGWLPWTADATNGPSWTLSAEFLFYLLFPALVLVIRRLSTPSTWIALGAALLAPASWLVIAPFLPAQPVAYDGSLGSELWLILHFAPIMHVAEFAAGLALGRLFTIGALPRLSPRVAVIVATVSMAGLVIVGHFLPRFVPFDIGLFANNGGLDIFFCLVIAALASTHPPSLSGRRIIVLGEASYALYILHWPVWYLLARVSPIDLSRPANFRAWSVLYLVVVIPLSVLSLTYLETPVRRRIKRWHGSDNGLSAVTPSGDDRVIAL